MYVCVFKNHFILSRHLCRLCFESKIRTFLRERRLEPKEETFAFYTLLILKNKYGKFSIFPTRTNEKAKWKKGRTKKKKKNDTNRQKKKNKNIK